MVLLENFYVWQKMNFGAPLFGVATDFHGRHFKTIHLFNLPVLYKPLGEFKRVDFAFTTHCQAQPF